MTRSRFRRIFAGIWAGLIANMLVAGAACADTYVACHAFNTMTGAKSWHWAVNPLQGLDYLKITGSYTTTEAGQTFAANPVINEEFVAAVCRYTLRYNQPFLAKLELTDVRAANYAVSNQVAITYNAEASYPGGLNEGWDAALSVPSRSKAGYKRFARNGLIASGVLVAGYALFNTGLPMAKIAPFIGSSLAMLPSIGFTYRILAAESMDEVFGVVVKNKKDLQEEAKRLQAYGKKVEKKEENVIDLSELKGRVVIINN